MDKRKIVIVSAIAVGFVLFVTGIVTSSYLLSEISGAIIVLMVIIFMAEDYEGKRKPLLERMENKDKSILPQVKTIIRRKEFMPTIMSIVILIILIAFLYIMLKSNFLNESNIDVDRAIKDGCAKLNMGGSCITDASKIIVPYDVNKDGIAGGINDTFSNLMENYYNCTGSCIRKYCGCS